MIKVNGVGPPDARIALIGEAPGAQEEQLRVPFVGGSGQLLTRVLSSVGIPRSTCYIDNIFPYRPPANDIKRVKALGFSSPFQFLDELKAKLVAMRPNVIVALGDTALQGLTGKKGIMNWRGSILEGPAGLKVIPTIHPAMILRKYEWLSIFRMDMKRVAEEAARPDICLPTRSLVTNPTFDEVMEQLQAIQTLKRPIVVDIELLRGRISCIGIATSPWNAICIPYDTGTGPYWASIDEEVAVRYRVKEVLADDAVRKCCHNAAFEMYFLGGPQRFRGLSWDTMVVGHCLYPELPKSLSFYTSIYTREPFYKEDGRKWKPGVDPPEQMYLYNCKDCAVTYEIWEKQRIEVVEAELQDFVETYQIPLIRVLHDMSTTGVRIDLDLREQLRREFAELDKQLQAEIDALAGEAVNVNSPAQLIKLLYTKLHLRPVHNRQTGSLTVDEEALVKLSKYHPLPEKIVRLRKVRKVVSTYLEAILVDGRAVTSYNQAGSLTNERGVVTGRLSSSKNIFGVGMNLQNIPSKATTKPYESDKVGKDLRRLFIPDEGYVLVEADYSQAEAMAVAWLAKEERLIKRFKEKKKVHPLVASRIFGIPEEKATKGTKEYEIAKRCVHAGNYQIGPEKFASLTGLTLEEATSALAGYYAAFPRIPEWHKKTEETVRKTRTLWTPVGRRRLFLGRLDSRTFRSAIAHVPQSMVADMLNMAMLRIYWRIKGTPFVLLMQVHDSILAEAPKGQEGVLAAIIREEMEQPITVEGETLIIPAEISVGPSWGETEPFEG